MLKKPVFSGIEILLHCKGANQKMQGIDKTMILSNKLDKKICLNSLLIMLSVTLAPKVIGILSIINISGAFKQ